MSQKSQKSREAAKRQFRAPRGMHDVLPADQPYWEKIETAASGLARFYNFGKLDPPVLEHADLFVKTGEGTDIVEKEMYTLRSKGGDLLALRPEFTPSNARAYLEHGLSRLGQPQKLFNIGPVFRHDRPQSGRFRQFSQINFEIIGGTNDPLYDAEIILLFTTLLEDLKIKETLLKINSIGCRVCRPIYKKLLQGFYKQHEKDLCDDCARRFGSNPLRLLDCKREHCAKIKEDAPSFLDKLCATCTAHFREVLEYLDEMSISYTVDHRLVRGLDYYNRTVFEIYAEGKGAEVGALPAGGRYDYLMELLGGNLTPAVGGACGIERLVAVLKAKEVEVSPRSPKRVFLAHVGEAAKQKTARLLRELYRAGIPVAEALAKDSLRVQLKAADKEGAPLALILGQKEIHENSVIVRDMRTGLQEAVSLDRMVTEVKKRFKESEKVGK